MPKYLVNGKTYDIPEDKIAGFEQRYPDARVEYHNEGKTYQIPLGKREGFLKKFPNASYGVNKTEEQTLSPERENELQTANREQIKGLAPHVDSLLAKRGEELRAEQQKKEKERPFLLRMLENAPRGGGAAGMPENVKTNNGLLADNEYMSLQAASRSLKNAQRIIDEADHNAATGGFDAWLEQSFAGGAARGFGQKFFDVSTWDMGITDMQEESAIASALMAFENGEPLTEGQQALLDAKAVELATNAYFGSYVGKGYKAGQVTAEAIPFMLEMAINPASGAGKGAVNLLSKYALKRFGKGAVRAAGDLAGAAVMTATTGLPRTLADTERRMTGDLQFDVDNSGYSVFAGTENGENFGTAFTKAFGATTIENYSEMIGDYFAPVLRPIGKGAKKAASWSLDKLHLGKVNEFIDDVKMSEFAKLVTDFEKHAQWNGTIGEYAEEVVGGVMNALTVGDQTLDTDENTGVFNLDRNIETFTSVALMGGFMSAAKTVGYRTPKYRAKSELNSADRRAKEKVQNWDAVKEGLQGGAINQAVADVLRDKNYNPEQRRVILEYVAASLKYEGVLRGEAKMEEEGANDVDTRDFISSFDSGYSLATPQEMNDAQNMLELKRRNLGKIVGADIDLFETDAYNTYHAMTKFGHNWGEGALEAAREYVNAKAAYDGVIQHVQDDIKVAVDDSNATIDARTNRTTGYVQPATMKVDDRRVYVVGGNVVQYEDGSGIDKNASDGSIIIRDAETGKEEMVSPDAIFSVDAPIDPIAEKKAAADAIAKEIGQAAIDKINGVASFYPGDTYTITGDDAQTNVTIAANEQGVVDNGDGTVNVTTDGVTIFPMKKEIIQQQVDAANLARLAQYEQQRAAENAERQQAMLEANRPQYALNDVLSLTDENGVTVRGSITADADADGRFEVYTEAPINGKRVNLFTRDELDSMLLEHNGEPAVQSATVIIAGEEQPFAEEKEPAASVDTAPSAMQRIPKDEQGNPIYEQVDNDTAWDAIVEQTEGDVEMAQTVADGMVADKEAALKKLEKTKSKGGATIAEKIAAEKERKAAIDAAKAELAKWQEIAGTANRRKMEVEAERRRVAEEAVALRKAEEEKMRAEREEAERIEREALNGVPDMVDDTPQNARARGYRRVSGHKIDRQEPVQALQGKEIAVKFSDNTLPTGRVAVIEAEQLQPSHVQGVRNPLHFIDEAQPKERNDEASVLSAQKIAGNIRPEEITSSVTAYTGAPTVNARGEAIQGNNRSDALRLMWENHQEQAAKYKQYLMDHAEEFGLNAEDIAGMQHPVLVNMLDVEDADAITLGQFVAQDTESGGVERIKPKNALQRMGADMRSFANLLLKSADEETSFSGLVDSNGVEVLKWMSQKGYITPTQYRSSFDSKGNLTAEAKNDLRGIMYQSIFKGGSTRLEEMFNAMPAKAQKAILATAFRDYDSPSAERMIEEIQNSIRAFYALSQSADFVEAKTYKDARLAVEAWKIQYQIDDVTGESYLPAENFSNFALLLATMYKGENQSIIQGTFNRLYDLIQGTQEANLFEQPDNTPRTLAQAINETLNITYNGQQRSNVLVGDSSASQRGQQGSTGNAAAGERIESGERTADSAGSIEAESTTGGEAVHQPQPERKGLEQTLDGEREADSTGMADDATREVLGASNRGDLRVFEEGLDAERRRNTDDSERTRRTAESERLVNIAKQHGIYIPAGVTKTLTGKVPKRTGESVVYIDKEAGKVTKVKDPYAKSAMKSGVQPEDAAFEHLVHNLLFPETEYTFEGISESMGDVRIVLSQKYIPTYGQPTKEQIAEALAARGLFPEDNYSFGNELVSVTDVEGDNVLLGEDGTLYFIDPIIRFKKPLREIISTLGGGQEHTPTIGEQVQAAEAEVNTTPTDKQKEVGNYKKGHVQIGTFNVTIEQPRGSVHSGVDKGGNKWEIEMHNTYGYIRGTEGVDGDHIDVFLSNDIDGWNGRQVYVIDQRNADGSFDEHKVMLGFNDINDAEAAYLSNYKEGWQGLGAITGVAIEDFEKWIASSHRKTKAFAEYKSVKTTEGQSASADKDLRRKLSDFNVGDVVRDYYDQKLYRIKKHSSNGVSTIAELDAEGNEVGTSTMNAHNNARYSLAEAPVKAETSSTDAPYSIAPAKYTTKKGKVLDMHIVKFTGELTKEQQRAAKELAKADKGWYDRGQGGFMMRSEESAKQLADTILNNDDAVSDAQPVSLADTRKIVETEQQVQPTNPSGSNFTGSNRLVTDERYAELRERMRKKLGGQMNIGIDPEILAIGTEMAVYHLEKGARKFTEYAKAMIADLGDAIRPYLKAFYNGARNLPEVESSEIAADMTPYDEVQQFNVATFDKEHSDLFTTAEIVVAEQAHQEEAEQAKHEIINQRNTERRNEDEQTSANTEAIASQAETVADKAESDIETATTEEQLNDVVATIDKQIEEVNKQLALLGYYEADIDDSQFHESYGYMRSAEKKAVKDADTLAKRIVKDLGIDSASIVDKKGKKRKVIAQANIAPAGGNVYMHLPLTEDRELYISVDLEPDYKGGNRDNLFIDHIMLRIENPTGQGYRYVGRNVWVQSDATYTDMLDEIRAEIIQHVPEFDLPARQSVSETEQKQVKAKKSKKKAVNSQQGLLNLLENGTEGENTRTDNSGTQLRPEELPDIEQVGAGTSVQDSARNSKSKRGNVRVGSSELGNRPEYDVNKNYTNEEIDEIVSSITDIVDDKVVITGEVTDDIKAICRQYESGGVAKKGRGILDEYYTDGKIVDAVNMIIAPYFKGAKGVRVLEPSVGVGNFIAATANIPTSEVVAFEINDTTARIAKILYPNVDVNLRSFETEFIDESGKKKPLPKKYSLVVGNPPYGSHRGLYKGLGEESKISRYEDYFVKRSLDVLEDGGILAMVLPSSWIDRHIKYGGYTIEAAYRLPSGAFEATQVGTDIVVLKKGNSIPVSEHAPYFEQHPDRILGEVKERKGRFGKMEEYIQGDIDIAIDAIEREHAKQLAEQVDIEATNDNLNDIQTAIEETGNADSAKAIVKSAKEVEKVDSTPEKAGKKYKVELNRGAETVPTSAQFTHEFSEGEVEAFEDTDYDGTINNPTKHRKYANFIGGKAVHDFYYAEGDIYSKLARLEEEKSDIVEKYGVEQYEKQKRLLESVLPKRKELGEITISPNTTFVKNLKISSNGETKSLKELFVDFCRKLPYGSFGDSSSWEVIGYVNNEQVHGTDKQRNQRVRERRKRVANDLFAKFLNDELSDVAKKQVVLAFNREYNSVYRPDYSRVPMFSTINKDFKGKPLKLTSVQLAGIGRMTVKGVGVLAHEVGFGKTLSGILAMHEAMTRGFAKKPLIVVPNDNILKQWVETIREVLPSATVNTLGNLGASYDLTDFKVNDGEFTIVTYEGLKAMSFSDATYNQLADRFSYITDDLKKHQSERDIQKEIEKRKELKGKMRRGAKVSYGFEDFGFDWLTFDEVHNANHIVSKVRLDKSVASDFRSQSQRTSDLGLKTWLAAQYIQDLNNGRNVLLLSATPFTNKPLEYYSILSLVANDMLKRKGFFNVDQFFATFMEADNDLEIGANGRPVQKTNVRRFRNNGLFQQLLGEFIDIKGEEDNPELVRPERRNKEYKIAQNDLTAEAMAQAQELLGDNDTVLQGIGHARAAAFSPYATSLLGVQPKNHREFVKNSPKIEATIKMIEQNKKDRPDAGQIVYSEVGIEYFPLIRDYLVNESGFKPNEVRIITGATSNNERVNIQTAFNDGDVKVVIGSPAIKEGLNLQGNTTDMYILSLPWNFTQLRQIEGRGWRQGNKWENIRINYMLTNDSVDVFMLQRLQVKQGLYNEAMKSGAESLDVSDIDTSELKTALITDPAVRAEIVVVQERAKLQQEKTQVEADLSFVMRKYEAYNKLISALEGHKNTVNQYKKWAEKGDRYWIDRVEREEAYTKKIEQDIDKEKESLLKKGVNVDEIVRQTEQSQEAIKGIQERIDNLQEYQEELTEKFRKEREAIEAEQGDLLATYIKERKAENKSGFYNIRQTQSKQQKEEDDTLYRGGERGEYDFSPTKGETNDERVERINNKTDELADALKERGFEVTTSKSRTSFGASNYINVFTPNFRPLVKIRLSDHSVLNNRRILDEYHPLPNQTTDGIIKDLFGNNTGDMYRDGEGAYSDDALAMENDPVSKTLGKPRGTSKQRKEFAERERQRMVKRVESLAKKLNLDNVEVVTDSNLLDGKKRTAKGFYSKSTGKITVVIPNHSSAADAEKTLLHEAVAHYGLRKLFGEHFDTFLDNVFNGADEAIRREIVDLAAKNDWDFRKATEEYLASLAENINFENAKSQGWWGKIKKLFFDMLHKIGFEGFDHVVLTDNELRYILWRSYENLKEPGRYRSILGEAADVAKQYELKVGNYAENVVNGANVAEEDDILFRNGDPEIHERTLARDRYEQRVKSGMFQSREALQDSMLSLKVAMEAIVGKKNIEDVDGFENAYLGENRLSSVNKAEADAFAHTLFKPMLDEVAKLAKTAEGREELTDYMMAKHGLERNEYMRNEALKAGDKQAAKRDFAGLTALTGMDSVVDAEAEAQQMVDAYEKAHDTAELWKRVNAVSKAILQKSYECGMMSKDNFDKISDMYEFYIPLRGFDEKTSADAYAYLAHRQSAFNAPIKRAEGRRSKADDPFANLQSMAESAIMQGNRNKLVKQRFLNFVLNHPSDLASVSDIWLEYDATNNEWKPVFPDNIESDDAPAVVEQKMQDFEQKMQTLEQNDPKRYKRGKDAIGIPYRVLPADLKEHQVIVRRGGRDYVITINGNPRVAQALNGQTNPDNDTSGAIGAILRAGEKINRQLSALYTTRNPDFMVSNFIRDMLYSNTMAWVKEGPNYAWRFHNNVVKLNPAVMKRLLAKHRNGELDMNNKYEAMFYQFMMNGGETGYANIRDIEQHKNDIKRELKKSNGRIPVRKAWDWLAVHFDELNRAIENCARFAAFVTSREMGRTIDRAIYDAKEASVNFNKKGSGAKFYDSEGQTKVGNASALVSGLGRSGFIFWNAAIQGSTNFGRQLKHHPAKAFTGMAAMFLLGAIVAYFGGDDDEDDKNAYYNLPDYVRRSNILFRVGDSWISIPLPVEYRAVYGMGELMTSVLSRKEHFTDGEIAEAIAGQMSQVLPIDMLEGGGGLNAFIPSAAKPLWEAYVTEKSWTGLPLYKDTPYNKNMPEWTKAYKGTNKYIVGLASALNEATGGDPYTKGGIDFNPAKVEYMLNGYFGGVFGTIDKLTKTAETIAGEREYDPRSILFVNRLVKAGDERTEYRAVNNEYFRLKEEHDMVKTRLKHYEDDTDNGIFDYAEKIDFLYNSPEYLRYEIFEDYRKDIDKLYGELKEAVDDKERKEIEAELNELKKNMIQEMNLTRDRK